MDEVKLTWATPDGDDLLAYMARVSNPNAMPGDPAERLIAFLIRHRHWSPFDMVNLCMEVNTTRDIGRQILRHWSIHPQEFSQRYAEVDHTMGIPVREMRLKGSTNRQGSLDERAPALEMAMLGAAQESYAAYHEAIAAGAAPECARSILPEGYTPTRFFLNGTIRSWIHYFQQRCDSHAQKEHRLIAEQIKLIAEAEFPLVMKAVAIVERESRTTREEVREFNLAFGRPVNDSLVELSEEDRILLGNLLVEETLEYVTKGLGLSFNLTHDMANVPAAIFEKHDDDSKWYLTPTYAVDPIECADGLGDVNVIIHFNALWQGFNLDLVTRTIHESNMSKLDEYGAPIINGPVGSGRFDGNGHEEEVLMDPTKPVGKILKGPNYKPAVIGPLLGFTEDNCPGHVGLKENLKICRNCGIHIDSLR